jgi:hypothetical protein
MNILKNTPLFLAVLILYNLVALAGQDVLRHELFGVGLLSGENWALTTADLLLALSLIVLYVEVVKSTRATAASVLDHTLSALVFTAFLIEFLAYRPAGTSTFFLMTLMSFLDVVAGFTITISSARRDIAHE